MLNCFNSPLWLAPLIGVCIFNKTKNVTDISPQLWLLCQCVYIPAHISWSTCFACKSVSAQTLSSLSNFSSEGNLDKKIRTTQAESQNLMLFFDGLVLSGNRHTIIPWFELSFTSQWIRSNITTLACLSSLCQLVDINTHSLDHSLPVIMRARAIVFLSFFFVPIECQSKSHKACEEKDF